MLKFSYIQENNIYLYNKLCVGGGGGGGGGYFVYLKIMDFFYLGPQRKINSSGLILDHLLK